MDQDAVHKGITPVTYFLQLDPISKSFHHHPIMQSNDESISELMHESSWSNHFSKVSPLNSTELGTKPLAQEPFWGYASYPNHNRLHQ
jgi:hypothetical protein